MTTHPAIGTSELVLTAVAIRLATMVAVCLIVLAVPAHPHHVEAICGTVEAGAAPVPEARNDTDAAIRDMLRHD